MRYEGRLSDRYNHLILKFFNYNLIEEHVSIPDLRLKVCLALEYIKFKTVLSGKKLRIHIHPKVDLDQRLSLYYLKRFMNINDNQIELIKWPELTVLETKPFDIAIDIAVFVATHLHLYHLLLQERRKNGLGDAVVLHQVLEHSIIKWFCYIYNHNLSSNY